MTKHVETIAPDTPIQEAVNRMRSLDVGVLPVSTGDRLVGMLTDRCKEPIEPERSANLVWFPSQSGTSGTRLPPRYIKEESCSAIEATTQGTVWPWLIGAFAEAWLLGIGSFPALRTLKEAEIGHVSETADGARGTLLAAVRSRLGRSTNFFVSNTRFSPRCRNKKPEQGFRSAFIRPANKAVTCCGLLAIV